ncbi:T9SS type A sorting domain-containing protein [Aestuariibaculum lutulentum]|uniref:T9SS type A sorting domain-containing protein n=1 Tax=Aestuariibaculum lutulentum TaxID=2920935 RepID=A0ABS9RHY9_9FLAO|nr:T9SS type A sorting domain-containing protein [Aestuariibaculum lutulentum]MCH4552131.1 T9SS type A sorting domain-containing protein [Aestuariibaculum lutulentum]
MNKTTITFLFLVACSFFLGAQAFKQGFDASDKDNWAYSTNVPFYSKQNGTDLWGRFSQANGRIPRAFSGTTYIAGRDLDNDYSQSVTGLESPEHILLFNPVELNGVPADISFRVQYVNLKSSDYIYFEVAFDDETEWTRYDFHEDIFKTALSGNFNSQGWKQITYNVPSGYQYVRMRIVIYQNGNAYLGFDDFELTMKTLSSNNLSIEGFSFGPNPTKDYLKIKANAILDGISLYNVLGKEVLTKTIKNTETNLDVSNLPNGVYIAKVISGSDSQSVKIIKK